MTTEEITALEVGTRVSYEDMANLRCEGMVANVVADRWGTHYVIAWQGYRGGEVSQSDCRQNGWKIVDRAIRIGDTVQVWQPNWENAGTIVYTVENVEGPILDLREPRIPGLRGEIVSHAVSRVVRV